MFCVKLISSLQSQNTAEDLKNKLVNENINNRQCDLHESLWTAFSFVMYSS